MGQQGAGVGGSIGFATEGSTWGTYVAPTRWPEFESESLIWTPKRSVGKGIYNGGTVARSSQRATTTAGVAGDVITPVYTKGMGLLLASIFGTMTITPTQQAATAAYLQTHAMQNTNWNQSLTCQVGRPTTDGTVHQYNYLGLKTTKAVITIAVDEPVRIDLTMDGKDVQESSTYVVPTYLTANPALFWNEGTFEMGTLGSEATVEGVRQVVITIERSMKTDNYYLDGTGRKSQQVPNDLVKITGEIDTDFLSKAAFADLFVADTPQSIIIPILGANIASTYYYGLTLSMPHCNFDMGPPNITGPDIIQPKMTFEALYDDTHNPFTATYMSTDTTL